jgi:hypothetical protein
MTLLILSIPVVILWVCLRREKKARDSASPVVIVNSTEPELIMGYNQAYDPTYPDVEGDSPSRPQVGVPLPPLPEGEAPHAEAYSGEPHGESHVEEDSRTDSPAYYVIN